MYEQSPDRQPRHTHYVSLSNGCLYAAMTNVPGYEDDNPQDWRPATREEIERYKADGSEPVAQPRGAVQLDEPVTHSAPASIKLADDDEPQQEPGTLPQGIPSLSAAPAAPAPADPPPAPAAAFPTPAFPGFTPQQ